LERTKVRRTLGEESKKANDNDIRDGCEEENDKAGEKGGRHKLKNKKQKTQRRRRERRSERGRQKEEVILHRKIYYCFQGRGEK